MSESDSVEPDSVDAVRSDIEATRTELVETVTELSDRLNPTKRVAAVTQSVSDSAKDAVEQAGEVTKDTAAKAQDVAKSRVNAAATQRRPRTAVDRGGSSPGGARARLASMETPPMIKFFYKPWGMLAGMIGGALGRGAFQAGLEAAQRRRSGADGDRSQPWVDRSRPGCWARRSGLRGGQGLCRPRRSCQLRKGDGHVAGPGL